MFSEIQARLSIKRLIADRFEGAGGRGGVQNMEERCEESEGSGRMRVGLDFAEGSGYTYRKYGQRLEKQMTN